VPTAAITAVREWVALQHAADRAAPAYVGDELRTAHLQFAAAKHRVVELRQRLAAAEASAERAPVTWPATGSGLAPTKRRQSAAG
jgi:hypothetical protein